MATGSGLAWVCWIAFSLIAFSFSNFGGGYEWTRKVPFTGSIEMLFFIFLCLVAALKSIKESNPQVSEISSKTARIWMGIIFLVAVILRIYHASSPEGSYCDDESRFIDAARYVKDLHDFRQAFIFPDQLEPFFFYFVYFLWHLIPMASSILISRIAGIITDLGTIWLLYLLGKEMDDRRAGIFCAALGALSKPLLIYSASIITIGGIPFSVALALLFTFRVFKKPDLEHFLKWGAAISFGIYTYSTYKPFIPFIVFSVLGWVLWNKENRKLNGPLGFVLSANAILLFFYYVFTNLAIPHGNLLFKLIDVGGAWFPCMLLGLLFYVLVRSLPKINAEQLNHSNQWIGWSVGAWFCTILSYPIMTNQDVMSRMTRLMNAENPFMSPAYISDSLVKLKTSFLVMFSYGGWPPNVSIAMDSFFSYGETVLIALGLAYLLAKPNWKGVLLFLTSFLGILPHALVAATHNGRLMGCVIPLFLLGGLGLNRLIKYSTFSWGGQFYRPACFLLVLFWGWNASTNYTKVYYQWMDGQVGEYTLARNEIIKAMNLGDRVYCMSPLYAPQAFPVDEGSEIHQWLPINPIYLGPGEKTPNVDIFVEPTELEIKNQIAAAFPNGQWISLKRPADRPEDGTFLWECHIPSNDILNPTQKLIMVRNVTNPFWKRSFADGHFGLVFDLLDYEDKVQDVGTPVDPVFGPLAAREFEAVKYEGTIHFNQGGHYQIDWQTANRTELEVDGHRILNLYFTMTPNYTDPVGSGDRSIYLGAGDHKVQVITCFQRNANPPTIFLQNEDSQVKKQSLWATFNFS